MRKRLLERESKAIRHTIDGPLTERLYASLPFELTGAQRRAIGEIEHDLEPLAYLEEALCSEGDHSSSPAAILGVCVAKDVMSAERVRRAERRATRVA